MASIRIQLKDGLFDLFGGEFCALLEEVKDYPSNERRYDAASKTWTVDDTIASFQRQMNNSAHQLRPVENQEETPEGFTLPKELLNQSAQMAGGRIQSLYPTATRDWIRRSMTAAAMKFGKIPEFAIVRPGKMPKRFFLVGEQLADRIEKVAAWIEEDVVATEIEAGEALESEKGQGDECVSESDLEDAYNWVDSLALVGTPKQITWAKSIALNSLEEIVRSRVSTLPVEAKWWIDNRSNISESLRG